LCAPLGVSVRGNHGMPLLPDSFEVVKSMLLRRAASHLPPLPSGAALRLAAKRPGSLPGRGVRLPKALG